MTKLYNIPTTDQLNNFAATLLKEFNDVKIDNITILFEIDKEMLIKVDEEYFFKNNKDANIKDFEPADEVIIDIYGLKFKFVEKK